MAASSASSEGFDGFDDVGAVILAVDTPPSPGSSDGEPAGRGALSASAGLPRAEVGVIAAAAIAANPPEDEVGARPLRRAATRTRSKMELRGLEAGLRAAALKAAAAGADNDVEAGFEPAGDAPTELADGDAPGGPGRAGSADMGSTDNLGKGMKKAGRRGC